MRIAGPLLILSSCGPDPKKGHPKEQIEKELLEFSRSDKTIHDTALSSIDSAWLIRIDSINFRDRIWFIWSVNDFLLDEFKDSLKTKKLQREVLPSAAKKQIAELDESIAKDIEEMQELKKRGDSLLREYKMVKSRKFRNYQVRCGLKYSRRDGSTVKDTVTIMLDKNYKGIPLKDYLYKRGIWSDF